MDPQELSELLRLKGRFLFHKESQRLEYKEQFNLAGLADYFKDFAAFANNKGGYLVFGIKDSPRIPLGLNTKSLDAFEGIDPERISGHLLDIFSAGIDWEPHVVEVHGLTFGIFEISEAKRKPVIARRDEGRGYVIRIGDIFFRYGGRSQRILSGELEYIIDERIERNNKSWMNRVKQIGTSGPERTLVMGTENVLAGNQDAPIVIDKALADQLKFIREGEFTTEVGAKALKLVGTVQPIEQVEVT